MDTSEPCLQPIDHVSESETYTGRKSAKGELVVEGEGELRRIVACMKSRAELLEPKDEITAVAQQRTTTGINHAGTRAPVECLADFRDDEVVNDVRSGSPGRERYRCRASVLPVVPRELYAIREHSKVVAEALNSFLL